MANESGTGECVLFSDREAMVAEGIRTRPDTRHKMRLVCVLFVFENNTGPTDGPTDGWTDGPTDGHDLI